jgi:hypothetical protein
VSFAGVANVSVAATVYPYLEQPAVDGLTAAAAAAGSPMLDVTSAFRTLAQQYLLYKWYQQGLCGITLAAAPGASNHETGTAVDLSNYAAATAVMTAHGWTHSYPTTDPVHFDYTAGGTIDLRADSVLAFQRLWNRYHPSDPIAEDGAYGPQTEARLVQVDVNGFASVDGGADAGSDGGGARHGDAGADGGGGIVDGAIVDGAIADGALIDGGIPDGASLDGARGTGGGGASAADAGMTVAGTSPGGCAVAGAGAGSSFPPSLSSLPLLALALACRRRARASATVRKQR